MNGARTAITTAVRRSFRGLGFVALGFAGWGFVGQPITGPAWRGQAVSEPPRQSALDLPPAWESGEYTFQPLARFEIRAVVLERSDYDDRESVFCPTDLALGWSWMSDAELIQRIGLSYAARWIEIQWPAQTPTSVAELIRSCTNLHAIPASAAIREQLKDVRPLEVVELSGFLVTVTHPDGRRWESSVRRDDEGMGACEVMWIEQLHHRPVGRRD